MMTTLAYLSSNGHLDKFFIDGRWVEPRGAARGALVNPATEENVCQVPLGDSDDVDAAVAAARKAFASWSHSEPASRAALLDRLWALLEARGELLAQCMSLEMGAAIGYARSTSRKIPQAAHGLLAQPGGLIRFAAGKDS